MHPVSIRVAFTFARNSQLATDVIFATVKSKIVHIVS